MPSKTRKRVRNQQLPEFCAPYINPSSTISNKTVHSCLKRADLLKLAREWNTVNPGDPVPLRGTNSVIWKALDAKNRPTCGKGKEYCWRGSEKVLSNFKPPMPTGWYDDPDEWLNSLDILAVMKQYELANKDFRFIGPVPIDFDKRIGGHCVDDELCRIQLPELKREGIHRLGIIFNLDPHDKSGSHWVAMFCCLNRCGIYYWDSYGYDPEPEIATLMKRLQEQGKAMGLTLAIESNNVRHQYKNTECGVYCLNFIIQLLQGQSFKSIINNVIRDDAMLENRELMFTKLKTPPSKKHHHKGGAAFEIKAIPPELRENILSKLPQSAQAILTTPRLRDVASKLGYNSKGIGQQVNNYEKLEERQRDARKEEMLIAAGQFERALAKTPLKSDIEKEAARTEFYNFLKSGIREHGRDLLKYGMTILKSLAEKSKQSQ